MDSSDAPVAPNKGGALSKVSAARNVTTLVVSLLLALVVVILLAVLQTNRRTIVVLRAQLSRSHEHSRALSVRLEHTNALLRKLLAEQRKANAERALQQEENNAVNSWLTGG